MRRQVSEGVLIVDEKTEYKEETNTAVRTSLITYVMQEDYE